MSLVILSTIALFISLDAARTCRETAETHLSRPYHPVYDVLHENTPRLPLYTPDYLILFSLLALVAKCYVLDDPEFLYRAHDAGHTLSCALILRGLLARATIIPTCMPPPAKNRGMYARTFVSTHDLMYSGHTLVFLFLGRLIEEGPYDEPISIMTGLVVGYVFPISLILARQHYTMDVVVAFLANACFV